MTEYRWLAGKQATQPSVGEIRLTGASVESIEVFNYELQAKFDYLMRRIVQLEDEVAALKGNR